MTKVIRIPRKASSPAIPASGIVYTRDYFTLQTTSYAVYDDAWQASNGNYNYITPLNPETIQELDLITDPSGRTLLYNNTFGNKNRFTDSLGVLHIAVEGYVIDNYTGLGFYDTTGNPYRFTWDSAFGVGGNIEAWNNSSLNGFNDWFAPNYKMLVSINDVEGVTGKNTIMLEKARTVLFNHFSSTTRRQAPTNGMYLSFNGWVFVGAKTTSTYLFLPTRIHFK